MSRAISYIVVHCAATKPSMDIGVEEIREWHKDRGWSDVGYHYVIRRNGGLEEGRDLETIGAHAKGFNKTSIGICMVGGVSESGKSEANFTYPQYQTLYGLLSRLKETYPNAEVLGHRDLPDVQKDCPCFSARDFME